MPSRRLDHRSNLKVQVQGADIIVMLRGPCLRANYRRQGAICLATDEFGSDDPKLQSPWRSSSAWTVANQKLATGMDKACKEMHETATRVLVQP